MYESRSQVPLARKRFIRRVASHAAIAVALILVSLGAGMLGYMHFEDLSATDAFLNSSMLLGGMGPVDPPHSRGGKIFAGLYALYAGLVFIVTAALLFTPVVHRLLHKFHWDSRA